MQARAPEDLRRVVVLATGGTIAGTAAHGAQNVGYTAGTLGIDTLLAGVPLPEGLTVEAEQVAQLDSKDMDVATWSRLAARAAAHLARHDVAGVVVTHGTDTMEETAYLLHRTVAHADKPLVLTGSMRPATSLQADGPANLLDALTLAALPGARGVLVAFAGQVWMAPGLRKRHPYRLDAFGAGDDGPLGWIEEGRLRLLQAWPGAAERAPELPDDAAAWPWVEIVQSGAAVDGRTVDALVAAGVDGLVVACAGNGSVHVALEAALERAAAQGIAVVRATRCADGPIVGHEVPTPFPTSALPPAQARVELLLDLLADGAA